MLKKIAAGSVAIALGFLLVTNPVVADAAGLITGKQIKNGSVTGKDIKDSSLKGTDVRNESLTGSDVTNGSLSAADLANGVLPPAAAFGSAVGVNATTTTSSTAVALPGASVKVTMAKAGTLVASFAAESQCTNGSALTTWCAVDLRVDGVLMSGEDDDAFDSNNAGGEVDGSWESHAVIRTAAVAAGAHTVTVDYRIGYAAGGTSSFRLDDFGLVVEGHYA